MARQKVWGTGPHAPTYGDSMQKSVPPAVIAALVVTNKKDREALCNAVWKNWAELMNLYELEIFEVLMPIGGDRRRMRKLSAADRQRYKYATAQFKRAKKGMELLNTELGM